MNNIEIIKKTKKADYLEFFLYIIGALAYSIINSYVLLYFAFLYTFFVNILRYSKSRDIFYILKIFIYSIIIPNNYIIIAITFFFILFNLKRIKNGLLILFLCLFLFFNIIINNVRFLNLFFGLFYLLPVILLFIYFDIYKDDILIQKREIIKILKEIIVIEVFSNLIFFLFHFRLIIIENANDWFVGTFGFHQGNIFLFFMLFSFLMLLEEFEKTKKLNDLIFCIICLILALLTNSISLILLFFFSYFIVTILKSKFRKKIQSFIVIIVSIIIFLFVTPTWVKDFIVKLTNYNYFVKTVAKIQVYEDTFINISKNDLKFFVFGNGIGQYSSRAALTCTGEYITYYNKLFSPSVSSYTQNYILGRYIRYNIVEGQGTLYSPFSTIITIQGEYGILGSIVFLIFLLKMWKKSSKNSRNFILFFFFSCFIENYLEFSKIMFMVFLIYFLNLKKDKNIIEGVKK